MSAHSGRRALIRIATTLAVIGSTVTVGQAAGATQRTQGTAQGATAKVVAQGATAQGAPRGLRWTECGGGLECARLEVPLDHARPTARTIRLALAKRPARSGVSRGSIVVNAGTQAGGGTAFVRNFPAAFTEINRDFDVVGLDTRAVGAGEPLVRCTTHEENRIVEAPTSAAQTTADRPARLTEATILADRCQERSGRLLPYLSSRTSARDLDLVRIALGERKLRFLGFSGGSVLGQNYLDLFPGRVAAMAFDSPYDAKGFTDDALGFDIGQMVATEHTMGTFFDWCRTTVALCSFGDGDPRAAFDRLLARTRQNRLDHPGRWDIVTDGALVEFISSAMLFPQQWPVVARQLTAMAGQALPTRPLPTGDDREFAEYYSQTCLDRAFPISLAAYDRQLRKAVAAAPYLGGRFGYAELKCRQWPARAAERGTGPWDNPHRRPVLVLSATDDPLAPHGQAVRMAHRLRAGLVELRSSGHLQMGRTGCADTVVREFFESGRPPARHTSCPVPLPGH